MINTPADVAQLEKLQQENDRLRHENSRFAAWLSLLTHDFRNTLTTLQMLITAHQEGTISDTQFFNLLPRVNADAGKDLKMIGDTTAYIRTQLDGFTPGPERIELTPWLFDLRATLASRLAAKQLHFETIVPPNTFLMADPFLLRYIMIAVLDNAIKYSFEGGTITVEAEAGQTAAHIRVSDTGTGMDADQVAQLFTLGSARYNGTAGETGAGLGLKIADTFARQLGGRLTVSSQPGKGTAVAVWLPQNES